MPESHFYQLSGFRAHSNGWQVEFTDDKAMAAAIISAKCKFFRPEGQDSPVQFVLGILPSGASYVLMTSEQTLDFTHKYRLKIPRNPWRATDFLSLSPIYFNSREELLAKFATYKQRPRNKNRREHEKPMDNSQANRGYFQAGANAVHYRAYFEQQRTLYRLLMRDLEPGRVGLAAPPWLSGLRVVSLVFEEWTADNRPRTARLQEPLLVNIGWTATSFPSFFEQQSVLAAHFKLKSGRTNPGSKAPHFSDVVEGDQAGLHSRLQKLFTTDLNKDGTPLMVLVHDEDMARGVLSRAGVDVDAWSSGLVKLLPVPVKSEDNVSEPVVLPGPTIVDTQKLVKTVMQTTTPGHTIPHSAKVLHMQTETKTCAGDDSLLQLHVWMSMAQGLAIDEQHKQRLCEQPDRAQVLAPPTQEQADAEIDPNDVDPNDMAPGPRPTIADDFSDDDDW